MREPVLCRNVLLLVAIFAMSSCASGGGGSAARPPLGLEECARYASDITPSGRSQAESFDSMFAEAQRTPRRRGPQPDSMRLDKPPTLLNGGALQAMMQRFYPRALLDAKRGGVAMVAMLVRADGTVDPVRILRTSGIESLDAATVRAVQQLRFSPGVYRGCPVFAFTMMPITWNPGAAPPGFTRE